MKDFLDLLLKAAGVAIAGLGVYWGLMQFSDVVQQRSVDASIRYVERYGKGELLRARRNLASVWLGHRRELERLRKTRVQIEQYRERHRQLVFSVLMDTTAETRSASAEADVLLLASFFKEVRACVDHGLCNEDVADGFFREDMRNFYCLYAPYIEWLSDTYSSAIGSGFDELADSAKRCY